MPQDRQTERRCPPGRTVSTDVKLQVGQSVQNVEVMANAQMVQTENARVSTEVSNTLVDALPVEVNGTSRNPVSLGKALALTPGRPRRPLRSMKRPCGSGPIPRYA